MTEIEVKEKNMFFVTSRHCTNVSKSVSMAHAIQFLNDNTTHSQNLYKNSFNQKLNHLLCFFVYFLSQYVVQLVLPLLGPV